MQLANIDLGKLSVSALNMRHTKTAPDISDILPSVRARGVLVPLLVRPNAEADRFEIVAGRRRFHAAQAVVQEGGEIEPLPCAIMAPGDDAAALEASLIENLARLDPDEVTQWRTFTRLVKAGRTVQDLSQTFGLTQLKVRRVLALGDLLPRIRALYASGAVDVHTVRHLTLATKAQQKDWLALLDDPAAHTPTGSHLKAWLFGGQSISTQVALFPLDQYKGRIIADLFGEEAYFDDADAFWIAQNEAIAGQRDALLDAGWIGVEVLEPGEPFHAWDYEKTPKSKGGRVFITVSHRGEVQTHMGYLTRKEARRARAKSEGGQDGDAAKPARPEVTSTLQTYIDLHRHAAVRAVLADHPAVALRLLVAHAIAGSPLWRVELEPQQTRDPEVAASLAGSLGEGLFEAKRRAVQDLLHRAPDDGAVAGGAPDEGETVAVFTRLLALSDADVFAVAAVVMGETLQAGGAVVEAVGAYLETPMADLWAPDAVFFDLIRDRQVTNAMLREVGGKQVADGNVAEKVKTQKTILRDFLDGTNNRPKVERWTPRWMAFPPTRYTDRPFATLARWMQAETQIAATHTSAPPADSADTVSIAAE